MANRGHQIGITLEITLLRGGRLELLRDHPHRNTGRAIGAAGAIGDGLAAAKTDSAQRIVQRIGARPLQLGEDLALLPPSQIRTRRRAGDEKSGETHGCRHGCSLAILLLRGCGPLHTATMPNHAGL